MEWWVWVIIGFVVIGLFGDDSNAQSNASNSQNVNASQNRGINAGDIVDVTNIISNDHGSNEEEDDDYFDLFD
ncbi:MAG: hypothetical protein RL755_1497 [Pseudomonadota bacterium]|jgi:hypothetical protein